MFRALDMCGFTASRLSDGLGSRNLMASLGAEFEAAQREAEARALGAEMYVHAARISPETVDAVAAVLMSIEHSSRGRLPQEVAAEFARQMMADSAIRHRHPSEQVRLVNPS
jgi:hypothetical protein